jgi:hypothetical protein
LYRYNSGVPLHIHGAGFSETIIGRKRWWLSPPKPKPAFDPNATALEWALGLKKSTDGGDGGGGGGGGGGSSVGLYEVESSGPIAGKSALKAPGFKPGFKP